MQAPDLAPCPGGALPIAAAVNPSTTALTPDAQLRAYSALRSVEARLRAFEEALRGMRQLCLHGGSTSMSELVVAVAELRGHVRQRDQHAKDFAAALGPAAGGIVPALPRRDAQEPNSLRGSTEVLAVADLFGMLSGLRKTGTLTLQDAGRMFVFEFHQGAIVHAVTNVENPHLRLGTILIAQNKITERELRENLAAGAFAKELLGARLVRTQTVSAHDLRGALEVQVQRIFHEAFALQQAHFSFFEGSVSTIAERASMNTTCLLLEAARQHDEVRAPKPLPPKS